MAKWLVKSEPSHYSIDDLKRDRVTDWHGVRNYQARNFLREMRPGDEVLIYHSVEQPIGVVGLAAVRKAALPDRSQFDSKSEYFDAKATPQQPRWFAPDLGFVRKFSALVPLDKLRQEKALKGMILLQRGSRLSVQPVTELEFKAILAIAETKTTSRSRG